MEQLNDIFESFISRPVKLSRKKNWHDKHPDCRKVIHITETKMVSCKFQRGEFAAGLMKATILSCLVVLFLSEWLNDCRESVKAITEVHILCVLIILVSLAIISIVAVCSASKY